MHIVSCWGYLLCGMKQIVCLACTVYFGMQTNRYSLVSRIRNVWIIHPNFGHISNAWNVILTLVSVNSIAVYILRPYTFRIILKKHSVEPSFASLYRKHSVISPKSVLEADWPMGLMLDTLNWGLCMHRECRHVRYARNVLHVGIINARWRGKRSRYSQRTRNPRFYVSSKRLTTH